MVNTVLVRLSRVRVKPVACAGSCAGPLLLVLISRFLTLSAMALYAASLGTTALAAYQVHKFEA